MGEMSDEEKLYWDGQGSKEVVEDCWKLGRKMRVEAEAEAEAAALSYTKVQE